MNFGFEYIFPEDYAAYASFLELAANRLHALGFIIIISIPLVTILEDISSLAEPLSLYSRILDRIIIAVGDFVCAEAQMPIDSVQKGLDYVSRYISSPKILLGIPNCCYEWEEPFSPDDGYRTITTDQADALVRLTGAYPETDPYTQRIFFRILEEGNPPRVVMCESAYSLMVMGLVDIYNLGGISFRSLNLFNFANYQMINLRNDIRKVLPLDDGFSG